MNELGVFFLFVCFKGEIHRRLNPRPRDILIRLVKKKKKKKVQAALLSVRAARAQQQQQQQIADADQ